MTITIKFNDNIEHHYNSFDEITILNNYNAIIYIDSFNNNVSSLPELPNSLEILCCTNNNLYSLPELPISLIHFNYYNNPIHTHIAKYFSADYKIYFEYQNNTIKRVFANKIGNWYLDCKYNPKYLYCRNRLMEEYGKLYSDE